jgi:L-fucose mutarotase/ribose pyranase (RbsD/FucU family)
MTVNELIKELQELKELGHGDSAVFVFDGLAYSESKQAYIDTDGDICID